MLFVAVSFCFLNKFFNFWNAADNSFNVSLRGYFCHSRVLVVGDAQRFTQNLLFCKDFFQLFLFFLILQGFQLGKSALPDREMAGNGKKMAR